MTQTNAQRQAAYRGRRAMTPRNEWDLRTLLLEAYYTGRNHRADERDAVPLDELLTIIANKLLAEPDGAQLGELCLAIRKL